LAFITDRPSQDPAAVDSAGSGSRNGQGPGGGRPAQAADRARPGRIVPAGTPWPRPNLADFHRLAGRLRYRFTRRSRRGERV